MTVKKQNLGCCCKEWIEYAAAYLHIVELSVRRVTRALMFQKKALGAYYTFCFMEHKIILPFILPKAH